MKKILLLVSAIVLAGMFAAVIAADVAETKFNFVDFFKGEWTIDKTTTFDSSFIEGESVSGTYNVTSGNYEGILTGVYKQPDQSTPLTIRAESETPRSGVFIIEGTPDEEEEAAITAGGEEDDENKVKAHTQLQFNYNFKPIVTGYLVSQDKYVAKGGKEHGVYQFVVGGPHSFTLTLFSVTPKDGGNEYTVTTITGKKVVEEKQPTFFQKFGPTIMIAVFFIGSRLLTRKLQPEAQAATAAAAQGQRRQQAAAAAAAAQQQPAAATKKQQ